MDRYDYKILDNLYFSKNVFSEFNYKGLEEKTIYFIGEYFFKDEKWIEAENHWRSGLDLATSLKDSKMEVEFREKLDQTVEQIRKRTKQKSLSKLI